MGITVWVMGPGDYPDDVINLQALMDAAPDTPPPAELGVVKNPMETAICIFTSGTTGEPMEGEGDSPARLIGCFEGGLGFLLSGS